MTEHSLFQRLRERKMVQWAVAYGAGALVLLEIADFLADAFDWPTMTLRVITVVVGFAFLAVLVIAWYHGEQGHQRVKTTEVLLLAGITLAGGGTAWWMATQPVEAETAASAAPGDADRDLLMTSAMTPDDGRTGVAVLPFVTIGDSVGVPFADGMTEDIIAEIASVEGLRVISRTSVMQYRGTQKSIPEIGRELGVDVLLEGSVRRAGNEVRIVAQLIDARTDEHLWTGTYDRDMKDILQVQSDVARDIATQMRQRLGIEVQVAAENRPEVDPTAFQQVVEGRRLAESDKPAERERGMNLIVQAVERDSNLVTVALPALAEAAAPDVDPMHRFDLPPAPPVPGIDEALQRAMRHAPDAPAVHTLTIRRALDANDFERARQAAERAIQANPNNAMAHRYYALMLGRQGETDAALRHLREAMRLDPMSPVFGTDIGELLYSAGRTNESIATLERVVRDHPDHVPARVALGLAYQAAGQNDRAVAALRDAARRSAGNPMVMGSLGYVFATQGAVAEARAVLDSLQAGETRGATTVAIAQVLSGLGELEEAARWLQQAPDGRREAANMRFEWLRMDPKFRKMFPADSTSAQPRRPPRDR